jgi:hypothetical protein
MKTINDLRKIGMKVRVHHYRMKINGELGANGKFVKVPFQHNPYLSSKGGKTIVEVTTADGKEYC